MKTGYWRSGLLIVTTAIIAGGCTDDGDEQDEVSAQATIEDNLAADGCEMLVRVGEAEYAPNAASRAAITQHKLPDVAMVFIRYRLTGHTGQVQCGWGTRLERPEIALTILDDPF